MANYPQLDDCSGVWTLKEVNDAVMGGYWREAGSKAVFAGGFNSSNAYTANIDTIKMASAGNATDFGDLATNLLNMGSCASFTRGIFMGGNQASPNAYNNENYYITFATEGNAAEFGTLTTTNQHATSASNSTRGLCMGGHNPDAVQNTVDFLTMASVGNSTDFGDLTTATQQAASMNSPTRALYVGGATPSLVNTIQFAEFATTGNFTDFGDLVAVLKQGTNGDLGSSTRGVRAGGILASDAFTASVEFVTMASQGNAIDYGDCTTAVRLSEGASNSIKSFLAGGDVSDAVGTNVIQQGVITTGGDWTDFGDLSVAKYTGGGTSQAHGGLNEGYQGTRIAPIPRGGGAGQRGLFAGGSPTRSAIRKVQISTDGNTNNFGDLSVGRRQFVGGGSGLTRGLFGGGYSPGAHSNVIDYITFSHEGNAADFGNLSATGEDGAGLANETRAVFAEGVNSGTTIVDTISFVTIATIGNITDFGNLSASRHSIGAVASTTRGVFGGGRAGASPNAILDIMEYITIASAGDVTDFGDLSQARAQVAPTSSSTRGVFAGGTTPNTSTAVNTIDFITIASTGDATDFGDLTQARFGIMDSVVSNSITGIFGAGRTPSNQNTIDKITIASTGDATDFGDLNETTNNVCGASNGHGGLS